jgi:hypothetical protein
MAMAQFPTEFIVYGVLLLLILLFNYIARRTARQQPQEASPEYEEPREEEYESPDEFWGRIKPAPVELPALTARPAERMERPRAPPPPRRARFTRESLIGSKRDLQRAIVLMTVLGPCRANEQSEHRR